MFLSPVRDVFRPASPAPAAVREKGRPAALWSSCRREKVRPASPKWLKIGVFWRAGRTSSRKCGWRGRTGRVFSRSSSRGIPPGEFVVPCAWQPAPLLAVLTLQCAAKPYWWHGGQPAQAATYRVNMRIKGPRNPPIGLTCAGRGPGRHLSGYRASESAHVRRMRSQKQKWGLTARRRPDAPHASSDTTQAGPRRVPPLVACDGRAVSAEKSPYQQHVVSYNPRIAPHPLVQRIRKPPHFEGSAGVMRGDGGI